MYRNLPNQLTLLRLALAFAFFFILNQYRYGADSHPLILPIATFVFIIAALTDALDGYLARRWHVESTFGRIMDPFCDKVLVIGAFLYLAGARFVDPVAVAEGSFFTMASGVYPWMVAVILARELLVTAVRGEIEGVGVQFGAVAAGKLKMILQSIAIPVVLLIVWLDPRDPRWATLAWVRDAVVYFTVVVTVFSGVPYFVRAVAVLKEPATAGSPPNAAEPATSPHADPDPSTPNPPSHASPRGRQP